MEQDILQCVYTRKSCRKFRQESLQDEDIEVLQKAVECAPSYHNEQPWFFVFIQNRDIVSQMEELCDAKGQSHGAPLVVIGFAKLQAHSPVMDTALAFANMQYAAIARGLGTCFLQYPVDVCNARQYQELPSALGVPEGYMCVGALAIGRKDMENTEDKDIRTDVFSMVY